ncbi:hypothetical protein ABTY63_40560 [Streptomyces solisilvae]|uniref:hypothetical protein n=1 Tax=Streptomyces malaysiensis TaxID=92644 RepID=UPI00332B7525
MTTQHTHGPNFGRIVDGCPRCAELASGAEPIRWTRSRRDETARRDREIREHDCRSNGCGPICTYGDW